MKAKQSHFNFDLPKDLISKYPAKERDESRLMVIDRATGKIEHKVFKDLLDYFEEDDCFIMNNTKVFPARLYGCKEKTGADIEVFLLRELNEDAKLWDVMVNPARKIRVGNKLYFNNPNSSEHLVAEVIDNTTSRGRTIRFYFEDSNEEFKRILYSLGNTPLPEILEREAEPIDDERFQTVFAKNIGAVAAPAAGLHFSERLMKQIKIKGVKKAEVTLHIGLGTFRDIEVEDLSKHKMDAEFFSVETEAAEIVNEAKVNNRRVCAVGTTTMRAIESAVSADYFLKKAEGWTNLFIFPPFEFHIANSMLTNFHLPRSSLMIMAAAFGGYDLIMEAYEEAVKEKYRFFTYGDAMLIL